MSRMPMRSPHAETDLFRVRLRTQFFKALDTATKGDATERLREAQVAFDWLADRLEEQNIFGPWSLLELRQTPPHVGPSPEFWDAAWDEDPSNEEVEDSSKPPLATEPEVNPEIETVKEGSGDSSSALISPASLRDAIMSGLDERPTWLMESIEALWAPLMQWAEGYQLHRDPWVLDHVALAFQVHRHDQEAGAQVPFEVGRAVPVLEYERPKDPLTNKSSRRYISGSNHLWRRMKWMHEYLPAEETRQEFIERMAAIIFRYATDQEEIYKAAQWEPAPDKVSLCIHLTWLVKHQCLGFTYRDSGDIGDSSIRKAIKKLAQELPLTLRPAPGRRLP